MELDTLNFSELNDAEIVARMRKYNHEKFKTLVRMHLSFELELNTDEFDLLCHEIVYEDKGKLKKWNRVSKKYKHGSTGCASSSGGVKNSASSSPPENLHQQIDEGFLFHLPELKEFLMLEKNLLQEGIFRKTGSIARQNELKVQIQNDMPLNLDESGYSAHDCATVFKGYLADLPEPLLTDAHYPAHLQIAPLCLSVNPSMEFKEITAATATHKCNLEKQKKELHVLNSIQLLLLLLPDENRQLLQHIIEMLHAVARQQRTNKMGPDNLATLFTPHLICPRNLPPEGLHYLVRKMSSIVSYMIIRGQDIFSVPAKLATDIRAYFLERKRKKTLSPEMTLDESLSDVSTVNTVYTFVDREKTAAAHNTNTTETELAQLYAHIQSLPESSKKRRLIKQFNKQNGQGTPLQLQALNRIKNVDIARSSKSLSDSIKKHIFHRSTLSKTPKKETRETLAMETPHASDIKKHKQRVLFQSPRPPLTTATPVKRYHIKSHPLQKSISSTLLLTNQINSLQENASSTSSLLSCSSQKCTNSISPLNCLESGSDDVQVKRKYSSAPVSRQTSGELGVERNASPLSSSEVTRCMVRECHSPLKLNPEIEADMKSVAWVDLEQFSNPSTPLHPSTSTKISDLKSRFKSEPNLSICDTPTTTGTVLFNARHDIITPINKLKPSKTLTRKLMKGVSMGNLRLPFSTPEATKRLVRTVSSSIKRRSNDVSQTYLEVENNVVLKSSHIPLLKDMDDDDHDDDYENNEPHTFEPTPVDCAADIVNASLINTNSVNGDVSFTGGNDSCHPLLRRQSGMYRTADLITSTPSLLLGRRSMSPITKSTQRMPKAMQESIMTPRSRKPVMVLGTAVSTATTTAKSLNETNRTETTSSAKQNENKNAKSDLSRTLSSDVINEDANSLESFSDIFTRKHFKQTDKIAPASMYQLKKETNSSKSADIQQNSVNTLSTNFREYLLKRSVLANSPEDASFSSHSDDFGSSQEIEDLEENHLSSSLLYCLDGNDPKGGDKVGGNASEVDEEVVISTTTTITTTAIGANHNRSRIITNRLANNPFVILNNARKRAASGDFEQISTTLFNEKLPECIDAQNAKDKTCLFLEANSNSNSNSNASSNKENIQDYQSTKKFLISDYPGETTF